MVGEDYSEAAIIKFKADSRELRRDLRDMRRNVYLEGKAIGRAFRVGVVSAAAAGTFLKLFADFEQGIRGVQKTSGLAGSELDKLGKSIRALSRDSIFTTSDLLGTAKAAAQLGVKGSKNILAYTTTISKLGTASDLTGEAAAFALARISKLTGLADSEVNRLASSLVALGNNYSATEAEIAESTVTVAAAVASYRMHAADVLGMGAAFASMGQQSNMARTATIKLIHSLKMAADGGGAALASIAKVTGMTGEAFKELFGENAMDAVMRYISGLSATGREMDNVLAMIDMTDIRTNSAIKSLAANQDHLTNAIADSRREFKKNTALQIEYETAMNSLGSRTKMLINKVLDLAMSIGQRLAPNAEAIVRVFNEMLNARRIRIAAAYGAQLLKLVMTFAMLRVAVGTAYLVFLKLRIVITILKGIKMGAIAAGFSLRTMFGPLSWGLALITSFWDEFKLGSKIAANYLEELGLKIGNFLKEKLMDFTNFTNRIKKRLNDLIDTDFEIVETDAMAEDIAANNKRIEGLVDERAKLVKALKESFNSTLGHGTDMPEGPTAAAAQGSPPPLADPEGWDGLGVVEGEEDGGSSSGRKVDYAHIAATQRQKLRMLNEGLAEETIDGYERIRELKREHAAIMAMEDGVEKEAELARNQYQTEVLLAGIRERGEATFAEAEAKREREAKALEELTYRLETEQEYRRMFLEGRSEQDLAFYEQERELQWERWELENQEQDAQNKIEILLHQRKLDALEAQKEAAAKAKKKQDLEESKAALTTLFGHSKKANRIKAAFDKAQAIKTLVTKMPGQASEAYGQAMAALPPPFGQIVGALSFAAVMAQQAFGLAAAKGGGDESVQPPGLMAGGMVPGGFSLGDRHPFMLQAGEVVVPKQNYAALERDIQNRGASASQASGAIRDQNVNVAFIGNAGRTLEEINTGHEVLAT